MGQVQGFNFKDTTTLTWDLTLGGTLSDVLDVSFDWNQATFVALWSGPVPTAIGSGLECMIPYVDGAAVTWDIKRMYSRLSVLPAGNTSFECQKSAGATGAFSAVSIATLTHTITDRYKTNAALSGTVSSGDLLRINFPTLNGMGGTYHVQLQGTRH